MVKAQAFGLGANDYLVKLPDKIELIARIRYHSRAYIHLLEATTQRKKDGKASLSAECTGVLARLGMPSKEEAWERLVRHASGKGRKKLELTIRMGLERRGGWRIVSGRLPAAPATALTLTIPAEKTEVRLSGLPDKGSYESTKANDEVQTALGADGSLSLQWRPKVAEGMVDQSLTAQSAAVVDVREDAIRMVWQVKLDFGRGSRDAFKLSVPAGYLVEQVTGEPSDHLGD